MNANTQQSGVEFGYVGSTYDDKRFVLKIWYKMFVLLIVIPALASQISQASSIK